MPATEGPVSVEADVWSRLLDLLGGLSRLADLGFGLHAGESVRSAALVALLCDDLGLSADDMRAGLYTALLHHVGCTGFAHETARVYGDELAMNRAAARTDLGDVPRDVFATFIPTFTEGLPLTERARLGVTAVAKGRKVGAAYTVATCEAGRHAGRRLGLPEEVQRSVYHVYELWHGGGIPDRLAGDDIPVASRLADRARCVVRYPRRCPARNRRDQPAGRRDARPDAGGGVRGVGGRAAHGGQPRRPAADRAGLRAPTGGHRTARRPARRRVGVRRHRGPQVPLPPRPLAGCRAAGACRGRTARHGDGDLDELEVAALLHDVGRVAVSTRIWEKEGELTRPEWEEVRLHAYHSERILAGSDRLVGLAEVVGMHHERQDGDGYHRGADAGAIVRPSRMIAAADAYHAMTQARPHRRRCLPTAPRGSSSARRPRGGSTPRRSMRSWRRLGARSRSLLQSHRQA